jgi:hypothetical protein
MNAIDYQFTIYLWAMPTLHNYTTQLPPQLENLSRLGKAYASRTILYPDELMRSNYQSVMTSG